MEKKSPAARAAHPVALVAIVRHVNGAVEAVPVVSVPHQQRKKQQGPTPFRQQPASAKQQQREDHVAPAQQGQEDTAGSMEDDHQELICTHCRYL